MLPGRTPPPISHLLGGRLQALDAQRGTLEARYEATDAFLNPAGQVQGGMLCAMLDDLCAAVVDAGLLPGQGVATLNLQAAFLRPARPGTLQGSAKVVKGGKSICYVEAVLMQGDAEVARATACCKTLDVKPAPSR